MTLFTRILSHEGLMATGLTVNNFFFKSNRFALTFFPKGHLFSYHTDTLNIMLFDSQTMKESLIMSNYTIVSLFKIKISFNFRKLL
jgi:hypothetical protein